MLKLKYLLFLISLVVLPLVGCEKNTDQTEKPTEQSLLLDAAKQGNLVEVKRLISKTNPATGHVLWHAVMGQNKDVVEFLLRNGANVNEEVEQDGTTVFMEAVRTGNKEIIKLLLDHQPNFDLKLENGKTVLDIAKEIGDPEINRLLNKQ